MIDRFEVRDLFAPISFVMLHSPFAGQKIHV